MITDVQVHPQSFFQYATLVPETVSHVQLLAKPLIGLKILHVNATSVGGGVAEMLLSQIPLERDLGLDSRWLVIPPNEAFFEVTKSIHNYMQGKPGDLSPQQKEIYLNHNQLVANLLDKEPCDILVIHDPQPAAALSFMKNRPSVCLWRCHIDTTAPNQYVFDFLLPYLLNYDGFIFTLPEFASLKFPKEKLHFLTPVIDPFSLKNQLMEKHQAQQVLSQLGLDISLPLATQVSRLDPWKDPTGVIDAFLLAKQQITNLQLAFVAQMASDDPEGQVVYSQVKDYANNNPDIHFFVNLPDNDMQVNAFQTASNVILQKSIREGFALTVTEAMWKSNVVIGGNAGGIALQIQNEQNGYLVNSAEQAARRIVSVVSNPQLCQSLGAAARKSVLSHYLMPHLLEKEFQLFTTYPALARPK